MRICEVCSNEVLDRASEKRCWVGIADEDNRIVIGAFNNAELLEFLMVSKTPAVNTRLYEHESIAMEVASDILSNHYQFQSDKKVIEVVHTEVGLFYAEWDSNHSIH